MASALDFEPDPPIRVRDVPVGCIGSGFIMADVQLAAYAEAGFPVVAIASRTPARAAEVARRWGIARTHPTPEALIEDPGVVILDLAFPPNRQPALIRHALSQPHILGILAQKPLAMDATEARRLSVEARAAGKVLSVNQNMRFDQSMRVLRQLLDRGALGDPVLMTIEMRAIPQWQPFLADYDRLTILNMGIHHLDCASCSAILSAFPPPRAPTRVRHSRTATVSSSQRCASRPARSRSRWTTSGAARASRALRQTRISDGEWRGWTAWRRAQSAGPTTRPAACRRCATPHAPRPGARGSSRHGPRAGSRRAFAGVMEQLQYAVATGTTPALDAADNVRTMALVDAAYRSLDERREVAPDYEGTR